jgi:hypothetical protein
MRSALQRVLGTPFAARLCPYAFENSYSVIMTGHQPESYQLATLPSTKKAWLSSGQITIIKKQNRRRSAVGPVWSY